MSDEKKNGDVNKNLPTADGDEIDESEANDPFQKIMESAGNHGRFQLIYNMIFVLAFASAGAMVFMNIILALDIPEHWCTVPGQELTNYTLDEWRRLTLPTQKDNRGTSTHSSCEMYNANFTEIIDWRHWNKTKSNVTACQNGWSYDRTWYDDTIPSKENWVCSRSLYVTNAFVVGRVAEGVGSFVLGQMGDVYGRRFVYYISIAFCALGRSFSILTTNLYWVFLFCTGLTGFAVNSLFQSPQIIGMEISREQDRSAIAIYQSIGWSIGTTFMPLLFWWLRDWAAFMWITTIPTALVLIFYKYIIESPRWLISKQRYGEAITQFKKIAKINGRQFDLTEKELVQIYANREEEEVTYGMASLFSGWHLTRNTAIMGFSWCVVAVSYFTLLLFSTRMGGNPFLNFLLQSVVEIPAYIVGRYLGDTYGRRFTNSMSFLVSFCASVPLILLAADIKYEKVIVYLATFIKFLNALTFFTVNLQSMEIYPTCMRQTGIALGAILANAVGIIAPYLVYLGTTINIRAPYYILATLFLVGGMAALFLPETLHKKLPDTLEEARHFGKHDKFFSLPKAPPKVEKPQPGEDVHLNQTKFAP
ncbi:carcinine transporter isoform X1 [Rhagoletis pomonella]|uniref:carcinine transporter isoform X1 n=2 Tax=Rhagoletis pomonella TaxID=28610 RepID=UPI0017843601|nr:carcinine transporter isoform X1 [Rhagoletis pomonella]XP_036324829.1 carcinine transporter isoform X1 [Rhagoletis pomonella]XP_036324830.1 carcinine transporter isoform X1 [Rhagoletis pomonella]XP_036324831.1 carcinine transporter isoform X1 [Rhagoletis pomonella]